MCFSRLLLSSSHYFSRQFTTFLMVSAIFAQPSFPFSFQVSALMIGWLIRLFPVEANANLPPVIIFHFSLLAVALQPSNIWSVWGDLRGVNCLWPSALRYLPCCLTLTFLGEVFTVYHHRINTSFLLQSLAQSILCFVGNSPHLALNVYSIECALHWMCFAFQCALNVLCIDCAFHWIIWKEGNSFLQELWMRFYSIFHLHKVHNKQF